MKFYIDKMILWMKNGNVRVLSFEPNKVNMVIGGCETGKSTILGIIDYCFFASGNEDSGEIKIPQTIINENIDWYGLRFYINDKYITLARESLKAENVPSENYYISSTGEIPDKIKNTIKEKEAKKFINEEFHINEKVIIPYGGKKIRMGSKISLRYFMIFNSQDENTITNSDTYFDKQTIPKYQEALIRVFDIALCISNTENILIEDKIEEIKKKILRYERKQELFTKSKDIYEKEKKELVNQAQAHGIIEKRDDDINVSIQYIKDIILNDRDLKLSDQEDRLERLDKTRQEIKIQISNINNFMKAYDEYKNLLKNTEDSLKPVEIIKEYIDKTNNVDAASMIKELEKQLVFIRQQIKNKKPSNFEINQKLKALKEELNKVEDEINSIKVIEKLHTDSKSLKDKYIFLGEMKNRILLYEQDTVSEDYSAKLEELKEDLKNLEKKKEDKEQKKIAIIKLLEGTVKRILDECSSSMETYSGYIPIFNYKNKKLGLQKPNTAEITKIAGSSSNILFLHIALILGLHEVMINQGSPYVPSFVFLDQPSRPYYDNKNDKIKDRARIVNVMQVLNDYINYINENYSQQFQMIVVEHIPPEIWRNMKNIHLVEEFFDDNKLIRKQDICDK